MCKMIWFSVILGLILISGSPLKADSPSPPGERIETSRSDAGRSNAIPNQITTPLTLLWRTAPPPVDQTPQSASYAAGILYYAAGKTIYAAQASDGTTLWSYQGSAAFNASTALSSDALYAGSDDANLYKISLKDGSLIWKQPTSASIRSAPVIANGHVYFGTEDGHVYALDPATGNTIWSFQAGAAVSTPVVIDQSGNVLFVAGDSKLYDLNGDTGRQQWQRLFSADPTDSPPACANNTLYIGAGQTLYAISPHSGLILWQTQLAQGIGSPPTVGPDNVYVATDDSKIVCLNNQGAQIWSADLGSRSTTPALLAGKTLLVSTRHGVLLALSADTGALKWEYVVQSSLNVEELPIYADNALYALGSDGSLSAFQAQAKDQTGPEITDVLPKEGDTILGTNVSYAATVVDVGSGVSPSTVSLTLDGAPLSSAQYSADRNGIEVAPIGVSLTPLSNGQHTMVLKATDWKGNTTTKSWGFMVDSTGKTVSGPYRGTPTDNSNSPYPPPTDDAAERMQERQQASQIYRALMRQYKQNGSNGPSPPMPPSY